MSSHPTIGPSSLQYVHVVEALTLSGIERKADSTNLSLVIACHWGTHENV
jgi:hypothetical protein